MPKKRAKKSAKKNPYAIPPGQLKGNYSKAASESYKRTMAAYAKHGLSKTVAKNRAERFAEKSISLRRQKKAEAVARSKSRRAAKRK